MPTTARQILRFRSLVATLIARELAARYRGSLLGFFWSLVNPLLLLAVYTFVFGLVFRPPQAGLTTPYALFLITGLFPWVWVASSLLEGTLSLVANAGLIRKAVFPAEVLPMVAVLSNLVHFGFALPVLGLALVAGRLQGYEVGGWTALLLPAVIAIELPLVAGLALGLAAVNVHFKDVKDLLINLLTLLFFLTPILYPLEAVSVPALRALIRWGNPFTPFTLALQDLLFRGVMPAPAVWAHMAAAGALGWAVGTFFYSRLADTLVEAV